MKIYYSLRFLFIATFLSVFLSISGQSVFVVDNPSSSGAYGSLDSALHYAVDGDYIYLPGGSFSIGNLKIAKRVNIIGAGHYPDSTVATGRTQLIGDIYFKTGADNSSIQGFYLQGDIFMGDSCQTGNVQNIFISRISVNNIYLTYQSGTSTNCGAANIFIKDCRIRNDIRGANTQNVTVETSIISGQIRDFNSNAYFNNNIFLYQSSFSTSNRLLRFVNNCDFSNNIFRNSYSTMITSSSNNVFYNNVFGQSSCSGGSCYNCLFNVDFLPLFEDVGGTGFDYSYDYRLTDTSEAKGVGLNGTDCGIYGGNNPFKPGAVPINPHIQMINIPSATDGQGRLNIQFKVRAQDR